MKVLLLLIACIGFSCTEHENPLARINIPAGKATVNSDSDECLAVSWPCDTEVDTVWTVFYGADYRFQAHGERILFSHYLTSNSEKRYWASETSTRFGRVRSGFRSGDGTCGIWSEAIDNDTSVVRVYKGDVKYLYRDTPNARYTLLGDDMQYPIASVEEDGAVRHRDFLSLFNRNEPRPDGLVEIRSTYRAGAYYLPVNFSAVALDTLTTLPADDRPYLDDSICWEDECPAWEEPICPSDEEESVVAFGASSGGGDNSDDDTSDPSSDDDTSDPSSDDGCSYPTYHDISLFVHSIYYVGGSIDYGTLDHETLPDGSGTDCGAISTGPIYGPLCSPGKRPGCWELTPVDDPDDPPAHFWFCWGCE